MAEKQIERPEESATRQVSKPPQAQVDLSKMRIVRTDVANATAQQQKMAEQVIGRTFDMLKSGIPKNSELRAMLS